MIQRAQFKHLPQYFHPFFLNHGFHGIHALPMHGPAARLQDRLKRNDRLSAMIRSSSDNLSMSII